MKWSPTLAFAAPPLLVFILSLAIAVPDPIAAQEADKNGSVKNEPAKNEPAKNEAVKNEAVKNEAEADKASESAEGSADPKPVTPKVTRKRRPILETAVATQRFESAMDRWRNSLKEITRVKVHYSISKLSQREKYKEEWIAGINEHFLALEQVHITGADAYAAKYQPLARLEQFLVTLAQHDIVNGRFELAHQLINNLTDAGCAHPQLDLMSSNAALYSNHFVEAKAAMLRGRDKKLLGPEGQEWLELIDPVIAAWEQEQLLRAKEAEADDLPRVVLHTSQGDIVIELFENEAPGTVGNFIYLVEQGFYDGLQFFHVERSVVAQVGCPQNKGKGTPGYSIFCECFQPNRRHRFAGTVAMAKVPDGQGDLIPNSAGSQFFIDARPTPMSEAGHFTVFGRVIEGFDRVSRLQIQGEEDEEQAKSANPPLPDRIISAKVLRKRGHKYVPNKVQK